MDKQKADQIIVEYAKKIYGFALKKSYSNEEAEELCAEMVKEVYISLLHADEILNMEGYIWRICAHVYAKYVSQIRQKQGVSINGMEIPVYDEYDLGDNEEEFKKLRKEIAFLSSMRRKIIYSFYYQGKSISQIAIECSLSKGTVKWHLNKARNELKEGLKMERKQGNLGIAPIEAVSIGHSGNPGTNGGPDAYLSDQINLNIVYSVYEKPKTKSEIAEELGMTPVFLEEKIEMLVANGFLVETTKNRYTTYVIFSPKTISLEMDENIRKIKLKAAARIQEEYIPKVLEAIKDFKDVYIPSGNRELFDAAVIFYAIAEKCHISMAMDISKYRIRTLAGGDFIAFVSLDTEIEDPEYKYTISESMKNYDCCGSMGRKSQKYPSVYSWSIDSRLSSREGYWQNNYTSDYEYIYEIMNGDITVTKANEEKFNRLRERGFLTSDGNINIMIVKDDFQNFVDRIPELDQKIKDEFAGYALEYATQIAKGYPSQIKDLAIWKFVNSFIENMVALMVMDRFYDENIFHGLTEQEKVTANLLMFADRLPD